jgi:hypothetical protein
MALTLEELWEKCPKCGGSGTEAPGKMVGGGISITPGACPECEGRGGKPTESGRAILELLERAKRPAQKAW